MQQQISDLTQPDDVTRLLRALPMPEPPAWLRTRVMAEVATLAARRRATRVFAWYGSVIGVVLLLAVALTHPPDPLPRGKEERARE